MTGEQRRGWGKNPRLLGIHEVLDQLEEEDEMKARIVKLRFFGGMKNEEIAALLEVSEKTIRRHWAVAKVWLYEALNEGLTAPPRSSTCCINSWARVSRYESTNRHCLPPVNQMPVVFLSASRNAGLCASAGVLA